jgi:hypothetical protein
LVEAAKRCFNFSITGKLPPSRLRQAFQHVRQMRWVDRLRRALIARKRKHGSGDLVLAFRRQLLHRLKRLSQELGHGER